MHILKSSGVYCLGAPSRWTHELVQLHDTIVFFSKPILESKQFLVQKYVQEGLSVAKLAKLTGHSESYVYSALKKFDLMPK